MRIAIDERLGFKEMLQKLAANGAKTKARCSLIQARPSRWRHDRLRLQAQFNIEFQNLRLRRADLEYGEGVSLSRSDGTGTGDRAYINTDGGTTWTAITTAA